jgi:DNA-binding NtrC family response regulator
VTKREVVDGCENAKEENMPKGDETILLAEDEDELRNVVKRFLEHLGFNVLVASNAEEAIDIERNFDGKIDLMLLDIVMPGMNGPDLWEVISAKRKNMKAVFITGYATESAVKRAVDKEYHIITKPFNMIDLVTGIRSSLDEDVSHNTNSI